MKKIVGFVLFMTSFCSFAMPVGKIDCGMRYDPETGLVADNKVKTRNAIFETRVGHVKYDTIRQDALVLTLYPSPNVSYQSESYGDVFEAIKAKNPETLEVVFSDRNSARQLKDILESKKVKNIVYENCSNDRNHVLTSDGLIVNLRPQPPIRTKTVGFDVVRD